MQPGGEFLQQQHGVDPDVAFGVELGRLGDAAHARRLRAGCVRAGRAGTSSSKPRRAPPSVRMRVSSSRMRSRLTWSISAAWLRMAAMASPRCGSRGGRRSGRRGACAACPRRSAGLGSPMARTIRRGEVVAAADVVERGCMRDRRSLRTRWVEQHAVDGEVAAQDVFARVGGESDRVRAAAVGVGAVVAESGDFGGDARCRRLARRPGLRRNGRRR